MKGLMTSAVTLWAAWLLRGLETQRQQLSLKERILRESACDMGATKKGKELLKAKDRSKELRKCITPGLSLCHEYEKALERAEALGKKCGIEDMRERLMACVSGKSDVTFCLKGSLPPQRVRREIKEIRASLGRAASFGEHYQDCLFDLSRRVSKGEADGVVTWHLLLGMALFFWRRVTMRDAALSSALLFKSFDKALQAYGERTAVNLRKYKEGLEAAHERCLQEISEVEDNMRRIGSHYPDAALRAGLTFPEKKRAPSSCRVFVDKPSGAASGTVIRPIRTRKREARKETVAEAVSIKRWRYEYVNGSENPVCNYPRRSCNRTGRKHFAGGWFPKGFPCRRRSMRLAS